MSQLISKVIPPIINIILARILAPEAFGVIATVTMIVSFTEMLTDAGFQKYLIQKEFNNKREKIDVYNVAFWSNFLFSIFIWTMIIMFNDPLSTLVGNSDLGNVLIIASIQIPISSFSSIQIANFRREFNFKMLFITRTISSCIPLIITFPLALLGFDYWSLIIGMISTQIFNAVYLTIKSDWKPNFYYNFNKFKQMLSFSSWTFLESLTIWLCIWVDTFVISIYLNQYYIGLYKTSTIMVNSLLAMITSAIIPVLYSSLSRLQNEESKFKEMFLKFQRILAMFVLPLGVGIYLFSDLATSLLLGEQWVEASKIIGVWSLSRAFLIVFGYTSSEVYRAKGNPNISFYVQFLHLIVLVPTCFIAINNDFWTLVYSRGVIVFQLVILHFIFLKLLYKYSIYEMITNVRNYFFGSVLMGVFGYYLLIINKQLNSPIMVIVICIMIYFSFLAIFKSERKYIGKAIKKISAKYRKSS